MNYLDYVPNPYGLAGPPAWFLADLSTFDPDLVLFPSQEQAVYRLGRKVKHSPDIWRLVKSLNQRTDTNGQSMHQRPDAKTMAQHGLVPVTSILPSPLVQWGPVILKDLAAMDIHRFGGAEKFCDELETRESADEDRLNASIDSDLDALAHQAYSDLVWKSGRRVGLAIHGPR